MQDNATEYFRLDEQGARELLPKAEKLLATGGQGIVFLQGVASDRLLRW